MKIDFSSLQPKNVDADIEVMDVGRHTLLKAMVKAKANLKEINCSEKNETLLSPRLTSSMKVKLLGKITFTNPELLKTNFAMLNTDLIR